MKKCNTCGETNKDNAKFCIKCGKQLSNFTPLCPHCKSIITPDNVFCKECGKRIIESDPKQEKTNKETNKYIKKPVIRTGRNRNFKIFMGLIAGFTAVAVIVILLVFVIDISNLTSPFKSTTEAEKVEEDEVVGLSEDQARVSSIFGDPDEFVIVFDKSGEYKRAETWLFKEMEVSFTFLDGKYNASGKVITAKLENDNYNIKPEDFTITMSSDEINDLIGEIGIEEIDPETNLKVITFGEGVITCTFDPDDSLMTVFRMRRVLPNEG